MGKTFRNDNDWKRKDHRKQRIDSVYVYMIEIRYSRKKVTYRISPFGGINVVNKFSVI